MQKQVIELYHQYLARLIKDHRFDLNSQHIITVDDFPEELVTERTIMEIIEEARLTNLNLSKDDIAMRLTVIYGRYNNIEDAKSDINSLLESDTNDIINADTIIEAIKTTSKNIRFLTDAEKAFDEYKLSNAPIDERIDKFTEMVIKNAPDSDSSALYDYEQRADAHEQKMRERNFQLRKFGVVGPSVPWPALRDVIPPIDDGQVILLQMVTGVGKSTVLPQIAEYQSLVQGYDTQMITFETPQEDFADRQMARWCNIHLDYLQSGEIDIDERSSQTDYIDEWKRWMKRMTKTKGTMYYDYMPGASAMQVLGVVQKRYRQSKAKGRKLVVLMDYLQVIPTAGGDYYGQVQQRINFAKQMVAEKVGVPVFVTAQVHVDSTMREGKNKAVGGQYSATRSQLVIDGVRANTTINKKQIIMDGKAKRDIFGNILHWISPPKGEDISDSLSEEIVLTIVKANYGPYPVSTRLYTCDETNTWFNSRSDPFTGSWIDEIKQNNAFPTWEEWTKK